MRQSALNWKPEVPKTFDGMVVRPEARWDHSSDTKPYNDGTQHNQFTFGGDVITIRLAIGSYSLVSRRYQLSRSRGPYGAPVCCQASTVLLGA